MANTFANLGASNNYRKESVLNNTMGGCGNSEPFALRVTDHSMEPEFDNGAIIIIDPAGVIEDGCYVLATVNNEYIFRQLKISDNKYSLQALQEGHPVLPISGITDIDGVIVQRAGTRRSYHKHYT